MMESLSISSLVCVKQSVRLQETKQPAAESLRVVGLQLKLKKINNCVDGVL